MRYYTIDLEAPRVVHAHPEQRAASALSNIELAHVACMVTPLEHAQDFDRFTDLELTMLLKHLTGAAAPGLPNRRAMQAALAAAVQEVPTADVDMEELLRVDARIAKVDPMAEGRYRYVKGLGREHAEAELWEPPSARCHSAPAALAEAGKGLQRPASAAPAPAPAPTPAPAPARAATGRAAPASARKPGGGSVLDQINAACDAALAEVTAGGSTGEKAVADAKALGLERLLQAGVNANSARKGSGMWAKAKKATII